MRSHASDATRGLAIVLLIGLVGSVLTLQGWRGHVLGADALAYVRNAEALLDRGVWPRAGHLNSYGVFSPPGTTWLVLPGMLLDDLRLVEYPGSLLLYLMTLVGIFLLGRAALDTTAGVLAAALYAWSETGLFLAGWLWPLAHPCFFVWMAYLLARWVTDNRPIFLAAALVVWAAGAYVFLALLPAILAAPLIWLRYRPRVGAPALLAAAAALLAIWWPFAQFQHERGYADLVTQILIREQRLPADYRLSWCDPEALPGAPAAPQAAGEPLGPARLLLSRLANAGRNLTLNFAEGPPTVRLPLLVLTLGGLLLFAPWLPPPVAALARRVRAGGDARRAAGVTAICLGAMWLVLLLASELNRSERFWVLWPLQALVCVGMLAALYRATHAPPFLGAVAIGVVVAHVVVGPLGRAAESARGDDPAEVRVAALLAERAREQGGIAVGYHIPFDGFYLTFHAVDPAYKVGMEIDALLRYNYGIANGDTCAEGISPDDTHRVVFTGAPAAGQIMIEPRLGDDWERVAATGDYLIYERRSAPAWLRSPPGSRTLRERGVIPAGWLRQRYVR